MSNSLEWHQLSANETLEKLNTSLDGLDQENIKERQKEYGKNLLPEQKIPGIFHILWNQLLNPLIYVLLFAAVISFIVGDAKDAFFILLVIGINTILGTYQEFKAEKNTASLKKLLITLVRVKRNDEIKEINGEELVPGDIILLESGVKVPADVRLLETNQLKVDESILTGESLAVNKHTKTLRETTPLAEKYNLCFAGTTIVTGRGMGVVISTGLQTELGKIAEAVMSTEKSKAPLIIRMERFSKQLSIIVLVACGILGVNAYIQGMPITEVFFFAIALAVAAIPESLPIALTVVLSIATSRMAKKHVIVRKLAAVESLGSCTVIASDKTGTLTLNKQTIRKIVLPDEQEYNVTGEGYELKGEIIDHHHKKHFHHEKNVGTLQDLITAGALCNEASITVHNNETTHVGDTVDTAFLVLAQKYGFNVHELRKLPLLGEIPFESEKRFAAKFFQSNNETNVYVKGAVENILNGSNLNKNDQKKILEKAEAMAAQGLRVIALASGKIKSLSSLPENPEKLLKDLNFLGLTGLIDPLRKEVKAAIEECKQAGIKVIIITGDHPATALSIAQELGLADSPQDIITGDQLDKIGSPDIPEFLETVKKAHIFARVTPVQKLQIVKTLHKIGHYIAVTGDGVNDAPALKKANIGIAMGSGTDIAKEAASIVITDDNFTSIKAGIEEGRYAYDNIRKVTYLVLSTSFAEIVLFTLAIIKGLPLPLLPIQLLWLNLVTNGIRDIGLAFESGEKNTMNRPPRDPSEDIINRKMIEQTVISGLVISLLSFFMWDWLLTNNWDLNSSRNVILLFMVLILNFHVLNCRSETKSTFKISLKKNFYLLGSVIVAQFLHTISMFIPLTQDLLRMTPVSWNIWGILTLMSISIVIVMEIYKYLSKKNETNL